MNEKIFQSTTPINTDIITLISSLKNSMFVAVVSFHANHPLFYLPDFGSNKEFAIIYGIGFLLIFLLGSGRYSIDHFIKSTQHE